MYNVHGHAHVASQLTPYPELEYRGLHKMSELQLGPHLLPTLWSVVFAVHTLHVYNAHVHLQCCEYTCTQ